MYTGEVAWASRWNTLHTAISSPTCTLPSPSVMICSLVRTSSATAWYFQIFPSHFDEASVNHTFCNCSENGGAICITGKSWGTSFSSSASSSMFSTLVAPSDMEKTLQ